MAEGRVADVMGKRQRLRQILVQSKRAGDGPGDLRDLKAVREAHAEVIAVGRDEHLRLVPQTAEGAGMDDAVAVALKGVARPPPAPVRQLGGASGRGRVWQYV